ncbi:MAG: sulfotransferase [Bacteroidia bacterium]|nr:sulfotransferase [Bacteroidia bacterium]
MKAIFIVGYWNSGTTLLVDILRKHPQICLRRARFKPNLEERTLAKILRKMGTGFISLESDYATVIREGFVNYREPRFDAETREKFRKIFDRKFAVSPDQTLLLKNPWLFFMPDFIDQNFASDDLKKIIILRDGPGQIVSKDYWKRNLENPEQQLYARAKFWVRSMEYFFEKWHQKPNTLTLRYENFCHNPIAFTRNICDFAQVSQPHKFITPIPLQFSNRQTNWNQLNPAYRDNVNAIIKDMQTKLDLHFPVFEGK